MLPFPQPVRIRRCERLSAPACPPAARSYRRYRPARRAGGDGRSGRLRSLCAEVRRTPGGARLVREARGQVAVLLVGGLLAVGAGAVVLGAFEQDWAA